MTRNNSDKVYSAGGRVGRSLPEGVYEWHLDLAFMPTRFGNRKGHIISTRVAVRSRTVDSEVINSKTETLASIKGMIARYKRNTGRVPSRIQVDRGWEYMDTNVRKFCRDMLIDLHPTGSNKHGQMGLAERYNRTLKEHVFATLLARNTPLIFWPEAVEHEVVIYNHTAHSAIDYRIPIEEDTHQPVDTWNIRGVFGCRVRVFAGGDKKIPGLTKKYRERVFLGIPKDACKGTYRVLMKDTGRLAYPSKHVAFLTNVPGFERGPIDFGKLEKVTDAVLSRSDPLNSIGAPAQNSQPAPAESHSANTQAEVPVNEVDEVAETVELRNQEEEFEVTPEPRDDEEEASSTRRCLRDRSTLNRPHYFIEEAETIYSAPQQWHNWLQRPAVWEW